MKHSLKKSAFLFTLSIIAFGQSIASAAEQNLVAQPALLTLANAGFEEGMTGWNAKEKVAMSQVSGEAAHEGKMGLRQVDDDEIQGSSCVSSRLPVSAGQSYRATFWARTQTPGSAGVYFWFFGADGKHLNPTAPPSRNISKGAAVWTQYTLQAQAPAGAASLALWIHTFGKNKGTVDFDDFKVEVVAVGEQAASQAAPGNNVVAAPAIELPPRKAPPYIIIKVDDLKKNWDGKVHPMWQKLVDFVRQRKIKASIGIICNSLEGDNPLYFQWIKDLHATGIIEFWNHGYDHAEWQENGKKLQEFSGSTYEHQKQHMSKSNQLAREKLGFPFLTFGAPFNAIDKTTVKVLEEDPDIKIWLYGDLKNPAGKIVLDRVGVNIENPTFVPDLQKFIAGYAKYPEREVFTIQGHPTHWNEDRWAQFVKIIDFLTEQKAIFMTPAEYVREKNLAPKTP